MTIPPISYHMWYGCRGWFGRTEFHQFPDDLQHNFPAADLAQIHISHGLY